MTAQASSSSTRREIDDHKLAEMIVTECDIGGERVAQMRRDDLFIDSKGAVWALGAECPMLPGYRVFSIFNFDEAEDVIVYGVPQGEPKRADAFKRWLIQKKPPQGARAECIMSSMTAATFRTEVGEQLWVQWVEANKRKDTRLAAEGMQAALEEVLGILKKCKEPQGAVVALGAVDTAEVLSLVTEALVEVGALEAETDEPKE